MNRDNKGSLNEEIKTGINIIREAIERDVPETVRKKKALQVLANLEDTCNDMIRQIELPF